MNAHVAFGAARTAVDNFETALARALDLAQHAGQKIAAIPGVTLDPEIAASIQAFRASASALNLSAYLTGTVQPAFKAAA